MSRLTKILFLSIALFAAAGLHAQQKTISGKVSGPSGAALSGVTIHVGDNKDIATTTDKNGNYTISVPQDTKRLVATHMGMEPQAFSVSGSATTHDIAMQEDMSELDEIVVIGYGEVKRKDLTGAVGSVQGKAIEAVPVANVAEAMAGKLAGVQITTTEGSPDADVKIRVRGGGSITQDNSPLYIVDGFPVSSISDIPSSDIASLDVLKDASSTAIYGSRGANGVILITTKSGKAGKTSVSYNAYYGFKKIAKTLDVLSPRDYATWQYEQAGLRNDMNSYTSVFGSFQDIDLYNNVPYNDWQDVVFGRTGSTFNQNVSVMGGVDKMKYAFSYAHINDKAIMQYSDYKRDNLNVKFNTKPYKNVTLDFSTRYAQTQVNGGGANEATGTYASDKRLKYMVIYTPIPLQGLSASDESEDEFGSLYNPLEALRDNHQRRKEKSLNMSGALGWEVYPNLVLKTEVGMDNRERSTDRFFGLTSGYVKDKPEAALQNMPAAQLENYTGQSIRNTNTVNFNFKKILHKKHSLTALLGHEYIVTKGRRLTDMIHGFPKSFSAEDAWKYSAQGKAHSSENYFMPDDKLLSFFTRANYDYRGKYLVSATFRADGSSKFSGENRWGYFPSAALAWRVSSEPFMSGTKSWLTDLKLRASLGSAGNNNIVSGQLAQTFSPTASDWLNGYNVYWGPSKRMANPELTWETTITRNVGMDFFLWNGKVSGTVDAYINTTKDLLIEFPVAGTGYDTQFRNMGKTRNHGVELTLAWNVIAKKDVSFTVQGNIGFNKNKIMSLGTMDDFKFASNWASTEIGSDYIVGVGGSVGKIYGYVSDGRYEVDDFNYVNNNWELKADRVNSSSVVGALRPGSMKLRKTSGDDLIISEDDKQIIGDINPLFTGGFSLSGRVYGFDVAANFNFSYGNDVYNANKIEFTQTSKYKYRNMTSEMAEGNRWTNLRPDGTISNDPAELAAMNANTTMWSPLTRQMVLSDWAVEDGSYLRMSTLTVGYTVPTKLVSRYRISNLRFYVTGSNLFCWTNYSGYDPEVSSMRRTNLTPGIDYSAYPKSRQVIFGLNLNF